MGLVKLVWPCVTNWKSGAKRKSAFAKCLQNRAIFLSSYFVPFTPFFTGYRPQFYFRTTDVTGSAHLPEGIEMVMPGDNVTMDVELITPIAMVKGLRFAIREGGRTVGAGTVTEVIE